MNVLGHLQFKRGALITYAHYLKNNNHYFKLLIIFVLIFWQIYLFFNSEDFHSVFVEPRIYTISYILIQFSFFTALYRVKWAIFVTFGSSGVNSNRFQQNPALNNENTWKNFVDEQVDSS